MKDRNEGIALNPEYDGYQRALVSMVYIFFDKKTGSGARSNLNEVQAPDLLKPVIKKFKRRKVYLRFKDNNIWAAELAEKRSWSSKNRGAKCFLRVIDGFVFSPYMLVLNLWRIKMLKQSFMVLLEL